MRIFVLVLVSASTLIFSGCADESLVTDEEYQASRGPAAFSGDPTNHIPVQCDPTTGRPITN